VVDANDTCADEPEDRDGFQDDDGCPERDNDTDGITDVADRCPDQAEDNDGFEDDDGCAEEDNDGDGFKDGDDQCPNDEETVNGFDDTDGCPDTRTSTLPDEGTDRINLKGNKIEFTGGAKLTNATKTILGQVATLIVNRDLTIRVEVHVPLSTTSKKKKQIEKAQRKDLATSQDRAQAILDYLVEQGVPINKLQAVGLGSTRPLGKNTPTDPANERVDFIKAQQ
jgi:outer membrane protein OmpA-like peptidoglycan-associated protein